MEGRWRRQKLEPGLVRTRTVLWQLAFDGVGRRWLVAMLLSSWQSLDPGDGFGWVYSVAAVATNLVHLSFITELAGQ